MEGFKHENVNKDEVEPVEIEPIIEELEQEKGVEEIENIDNFVDEEKELVVSNPEEKESRTKTTFKKVVIGATIMASLWSMGKMESKEVEAAGGVTKAELMNSLRNTIELAKGNMEEAGKATEMMVDYAKLPNIEILRKSINRFNKMWIALENDEEGTVEKIKKAGKLEFLIDTADKGIQEFDNMGDSLIRVLEDEGVGIDNLKNIKEILEKYL